MTPPKPGNEWSELEAVIRKWADLNPDPDTGGFEQEFQAMLFANITKGVADWHTAEVTKKIVEARIEEVKLCQGEKPINKERYLRNRQNQLEYDLENQIEARIKELKNAEQ